MNPNKPCANCKRLEGIVFVAFAFGIAVSFALDLTLRWLL